MRHRASVYRDVLDAAISANLAHHSAYTQAVVKAAQDAEVRTKRAMEELMYGGLTLRTQTESQILGWDEEATG